MAVCLRSRRVVGTAFPGSLGSCLRTKNQGTIVKAQSTLLSPLLTRADVLLSDCHAIVGASGICQHLHVKPSGSDDEGYSSLKQATSARHQDIEEYGDVYD